MLLVDSMERQDRIRSDRVDVVEGLSVWIEGMEGSFFICRSSVPRSARDVVLSVSVGGGHGQDRRCQIKLTVACSDAVVQILEVKFCVAWWLFIAKPSIDLKDFGGRDHACFATPPLPALVVSLKVDEVAATDARPPGGNATQRTVVALAFGGQLFRLVFSSWQRTPEGMCIRFLVDIVGRGRLEHLVPPTGLIGLAAQC